VQSFQEFGRLAGRIVLAGLAAVIVADGVSYMCFRSLGW
jgi:hypothetical protein